MENRREILVFPREALPAGIWFAPWPEAGPILEAVAAGMTWMPRSVAERSEEWLQPIPCAIIRNGCGEYRVLRRVKQERADLSSRVSLVVGGHIDRCSDSSSLASLLSATLERELDEELGVSSLSEIQPVGVVVDTASVAASRHIGFVNEIVVTSHFTPKAVEEFSTRSKLHSQSYRREELSNFLKEFDPWSRIIFADYIVPSYSSTIGIQQGLQLARNG